MPSTQVVAEARSVGHDLDLPVYLRLVGTLRGWPNQLTGGGEIYQGSWHTVRAKSLEKSVPLVDTG